VSVATQKLRSVFAACAPCHALPSEHEATKVDSGGWRPCPLIPSSGEPCSGVPRSSVGLGVCRRPLSRMGLMAGQFSSPFEREKMGSDAVRCGGADSQFQRVRIERLLERVAGAIRDADCREVGAGAGPPPRRPAASSRPVEPAGGLTPLLAPPRALAAREAEQSASERGLLAPSRAVSAPAPAAGARARG
jgi:hypothetical protein